ncbi:MAG: hypothetical protein QOE83_1432 [Actinomycetota bacterium]|nr:hypothetical protein [Actinomycetota bacterium]
MSSGREVLQSFYAGWAEHQRLLLAAIGTLSQDQLALRTSPVEMTIWQIASHMAGSRAYWFHDVLGEGDRATRDMFRVASTTVPDLSLEDAGWEDDENHPRAADEIVDAFHKTWGMVDDCLNRWTPEDLVVQLPQAGADRSTTRGWVIWHLMEHETHHGGAISLILGTNGLPGLDI